MATFIFMAFTHSRRHCEAANMLKFIHFLIVWDQRHLLTTIITKKGGFLLSPECYGH